MVLQPPDKYGGMWMFRNLCYMWLWFDICNEGDKVFTFGIFHFMKFVVRLLSPSLFRC